MTISSTSSSTDYTANGDQTDFDVPFKFFDHTDLIVTEIDDDGTADQKALSADYTVSGGGGEDGTVSFNAAPEDGKTIRIERWLDPVQESDYLTNGVLDAETIERDYDRVYMILQQLAARTGGTAQSVASGEFLGRQDGNTNRWDAQSDRITNVAEPTEDQDAATKAYADQLSGSTLGPRTIDGVQNDGGNIDFVSSGNMNIIPEDENDRVLFEVGERISTVDGVGPDDDGDVGLEAGAGVNLTPDAGNSKITVAAKPGTALWNALKLRGQQLASGVANPSSGQILEYDGSQWKLGSKSADSVNGVKSVDGVQNDGGDVDLIAGTGVDLTPDDAANEITIAVPNAENPVQTIDGVEPDGSGDFGLTGGTGVSLSGGTNAVTIDADADTALWNALKLRGGTLASGVASPSDGQILEWNASASEWRLASKSGDAVNGINSVDGVENSGGDVDLVAGDGVTIDPDDNANTVTIAAPNAKDAVQTVDGVGIDGQGDIDLIAGTGMTITPDAEANTITFEAAGTEGNATQIQSRAVKDEAPTGGDWLGWDAGASTWAPLGQYAVLRDEKAQGTHGGTFEQGAWRTRDLNTKQIDGASVITSLSSNRFKPKAGTYRVRISAPAIQTGSHRLRLRNVTDGSIEFVGTTEWSPGQVKASNRAKAIGRITTDGTKELEVQHRGASTRSVIGFGQAAGFGGDEVYTVVELIKEQ